MIKKLGESLKRHITGTKSPEREKGRLLSSVLVIVFFFVVGTFTGFYLHDKWEEWKAKPNVEIIMPAFPDIADHFPIQVVNNGDFKLTGIKVRVKSCYDKGVNKLFYPDNMPKPSTQTIDYVDNFTLSMYDKADCREGKKINSFDIPLYKDPKTGQIIGKTTEGELFSCGTCYWNITFESNQLNRSFRKEMYSPIQINVGVFTEGNINYSHLIPFSSIGMYILDKRMVEMLNVPEK